MIAMKQITQKEVLSTGTFPRKSNWSQLIIVWVYLPILLLVSTIACYFSYTQRKDEVLTNANFTFQQLVQTYNTTLENFLQLYLPIFESNSGNLEVINHYFVASPAPELDPWEKMDLNDTLKQMLSRDNHVQWIALYSDHRETNYILFKGESTMQELPEDFPYLEDIQHKSTQMEVYGTEKCKSTYSNSFVTTYAVCGGVLQSMGSGKIIAGYPVTAFESISSNAKPLLNSLEYIITATDRVLFHSNKNYDEQSQYLPEVQFQGTIDTLDGSNLYLHSKYGNSHTALISYKYDKWELFFYSHNNTPVILLIVAFFAVFSTWVTSFIIKQISKEVDIIRHGLAKIGENQLTYQLPTAFRQPGLNDIADAVNSMTIRLNENINRAYYYELKQKESELSELQAKFNPHFLYNSLEMIRSRCYQNGDSQTADLVSQLAAIFRGFIGSKTFIPLPEELAFSKRYLALFGARYKGQVDIQYEVDMELMQYGIVRNIFQPLIENYFVHGFETSSEQDNYIRITGKSLDEKFMILTVEDNGSGMTDEELKILNNSLQEPIQMTTESYGLKNLHQRLRLFYGEDCGLTICHNGDKGLSIHMKVRKMKC